MNYELSPPEPVRAGIMNVNGGQEKRKAPRMSTFAGRGRGKVLLQIRNSGLEFGFGFGEVDPLCFVRKIEDFLVNRLKVKL